MDEFAVGASGSGRQTHFDLRQAARAAHAAELVYSSGDEVEQELVDRWEMQDAEFFDVQDTQAFVAANDHCVLVSFRGTEPDSLRDWITDASTDLVAGPLGGNVHAGFYDALANVWQTLDHLVEHLLISRRRRLFVTGHSLGAALATLAVARWLDDRRPVQAMYTFGQPRTGDTTFARNFNFAFKPSSFRFVNNNDLVTRIPPRAFGYSHIGSFRYFNEVGEIAEQIKWWQGFLDRWQGRIEDVFSSIRDGIDDHSMSEYRRLVDSVCRQEAIANRFRQPTIDRFVGSFLGRSAMNSRQAA